jgi:hypothetical protein
MKKLKTRNVILIAGILSVLFLNPLNAQNKLTKVRGTVIDSVTKEPLPFVTIFFKGTNVGIETDLNGQYNLESKFASDKLSASFLGYHLKTYAVKIGSNTKIDFRLAPTSFSLAEVQVKAKRKRYRNKNNPAVDLLKEILANRDKNRKEGLDFYEYDKYEKLQIDRNNFTNEFRKKRRFKNLQFIFEYADTSKINGKPFLPMFIKEAKSKVYYRKSPKVQKEYLEGQKMVGLEKLIDNQGLGSYIDNMYQEINIYKDRISFMTHEFISPISNIGPSVYKYFIIDTVNVNGIECIDLGFQPRTRGNFCFNGHLYISNDKRYTVIKVKMGVPNEINLNFVSDVQIDQEFSFINNIAWMLTKDDLVVDINLGSRGKGYFIRKLTSYKDYVFNKERDFDTYHAFQKVIKLKGYDRKSEDYWTKARHKKLTKQEEGIYKMVDTLQKIPAFKRTMNLLSLALFGFWDAGPISIGNVSTFYAFNDIEGFKGKFGLETNKNFSEPFKLETYIGYGFKDKRWKYAVGLTYSFTGRHCFENPRHYIKAIIQQETLFPGMEMTFINEDNFLLSFKRGVADKIMYYFKKDFEYNYDVGNGLTFNFHLNHTVNEPGAVTYTEGRNVGAKSWEFKYKDGSILDKITRSEFQANIRIAPNEKYIQGRNYRVPIFTRYPVTQIKYVHGFKNLLGSNFKYDKLSIDIFKRFYPSPFGETDVEIEGGILFGDVPLPLLFIMRANQTYSYQITNYNMMNFMEFVADKFASIRIEHSFNGYFFNKIPLLKRLKLREVITFKGLIGSLRDENNPDKSNTMLFPRDMNGKLTTYSLDKGPYIEVSVGVENIFKFFRVDLVRRLTYLDNPNVVKYGIRARFRLHF